MDSGHRPLSVVMLEQACAVAQTSFVENTQSQGGQALNASQSEVPQTAQQVPLTGIQPSEGVPFKEQVQGHAKVSHIGAQRTSMPYFPLLPRCLPERHLATTRYVKSEHRTSMKGTLC